MEYYSAIKRHAFQSVLVRWMNLKYIIQREVSQKEKNKYCILTHIYGIQKDSSAEVTCRAAVKTQIQRTEQRRGGEQGEGVTRGGSNRRHRGPDIRQIPAGICCVTQAAHTAAL